MAEWTKLTDKKFHDRKWELKHDGQVLGTIFKQPAAFGNPERFALYVSSPKVYEHYTDAGNRSHKFDTFEEATAAFEQYALENLAPWANAILAHLNQ